MGVPGPAGAFPDPGRAFPDPREGVLGFAKAFLGLPGFTLSYFSQFLSFPWPGGVFPDPVGVPGSAGGRSRTRGRVFPALQMHFWMCQALNFVTSSSFLSLFLFGFGHSMQAAGPGKGSQCFLAEGCRACSKVANRHSNFFRIQFSGCLFLFKGLFLI